MSKATTAALKDYKAGHREASTPLQATMQGGVAGAIGAALTATILSSYPDSTTALVFAPIAGAAVIGTLTGLGTWARNRVHSGERGVGLLVAHVLAWLG